MLDLNSIHPYNRSAHHIHQLQRQTKLVSSESVNALVSLIWGWKVEEAWSVCGHMPIDAAPSKVGIRHPGASYRQL